MPNNKKYYEGYKNNANQQIIITYILGVTLLIFVCFIPFLIPVGVIIGLGFIKDISKQKKFIKHARDNLSKINNKFN